MKYTPVAVITAALVLGVAGTSVGQVVVQRRASQAAIEMRFGNSPERRARIGVIISQIPHETDSIGALIEAVSPGGPADRAGIRSGDLIAKVEGRIVGSTTERPGMRLSDFLGVLEPYDTVAIEFSREGNRQIVSVVTAPALSITFGPADDSAQNLFNLLASPLADLSLAPINTELGQYFGTAEGVLVINAPAGTKLGLKGGDVILSVNGRKLSDPDRVLRILRNRRSQAVSLDVLRNRRHLSLKVAPDTTNP